VLRELVRPCCHHQEKKGDLHPSHPNITYTLIDREDPFESGAFPLDISPQSVQIPQGLLFSLSVSYTRSYEAKTVLCKIRSFCFWVEISSFPKITNYI
jgi:hypothetical protein